MSESGLVAIAVEKFKSRQRAENRAEKIRLELEQILPRLTTAEQQAYVRITDEIPGNEWARLRG